MSAFLDLQEPSEMQGRDLPPWQHGEAMPFVACRLGDSPPKDKLDGWKADREAWLSSHPVPRSAADTTEYHRLFTGKFEFRLDAGAAGVE